MNKIELIDAIQQVITPNGKKAISAESLANLLIEIVSAIPEGGNGGSGQVVFYVGDVDVETFEFTLTAEQKTHNAEMFKIIKESPISLSATYDARGLLAAEMPEEMVGVDVSALRYNSSGLMTAYVPAHLTELMGLPTTEECVFCFDNTLPILVYADGSVTIAA